ncbi:replication initiator [Streptomyces sp. V1I1]|uniref:replication initiator n=1 Tax=Streptomyces sp. V1I1 TaxID=3042272 RepID=UPI0027D80813|nr:replication initiator [Streptomyces sp. V1I1]
MRRHYHDPPPPWATTDALTTAVRTAARAVTVHTPYSPATGEHALRWGAQFDARPLRAFDDGDGLADDAVAAYVAKYVTKGAADTATGTDYRLTSADDIETSPVSSHLRSLTHACWRLGGLPEFAPPAAPGLGPHPRIPRPHPHQIPRLIHDVRRASCRPSGAPEAGRNARHSRQCHHCQLALHRFRAHRRRCPHRCGDR